MVATRRCLLVYLLMHQVQNVMRGNSKMEEALQRITGHTVAKIHEDFQRDFYLSSAEAVQYGIIDEVLLPREKTRQDIYKQRGVSCLSFFVVFPCHVSSPSALAYYFFIQHARNNFINPQSGRKNTCT